MFYENTPSVSVSDDGGISLRGKLQYNYFALIGRILP